MLTRLLLLHLLATAMPDPCAALRALPLSHGAVLASEPVDDGVVVVPAREATSRSELHLSGLPPFCRVRLRLAPAASSDIRVEVWLPAKWNERSLQVGNGGFAGTLHHAQMATYLQRGYVAVATDNGHRGYDDDTSWLVGVPEQVAAERLQDFGWRAVHAANLAARSVVAAFYGRPARHRYFAGCSDGGREALMEAQRFPADFHGLIAGAPAAWWTHGYAGLLFASQRMAAAGAPLTLVQLSALSGAARDACDGLDGVVDRVIDAPDHCGFDPGTLACTGAPDGRCLTQRQVELVRALYKGLPSAHVHGFHSSIGVEDAAFQWRTWFTGPTMWGAAEPLAGPLARGFFGAMLRRGDVELATLDVAAEVARADRELGATLNATSPDLRAAREAGAKLLQYHGVADVAVPVEYSRAYYQAVIQHMGDPRDFYRLFLVPGMQHCMAGGPGADLFNGVDNAGAPRDAQHDVLEALQEWVEAGRAPDRLVATKPTQAPGEVVRTRALCPHPQVARWTGEGSTDDAARFVCRAP